MGSRRRMNWLALAALGSLALAPTFADAGMNRCSKYIMSRAVIDMEATLRDGRPHLRVFRGDSAIGRILNGVAHLFKNVLRLDDLAQVLLRMEERDATRPYFGQAADAFLLKTEAAGEGLAKIPSSGPVVFYANHPLSGADVFAIGSVLEKARPDFKVIAASYLENLPGFKEHAFIVNVLNTPEAKRANRAVIEEANRHVREGGALLIFPAGSVSRLENESAAFAVDPEWRNGLLKFGAQSPSTVYQPIYVGGQPSEEYLRLRLKSVALSNAYVFRELANQIGTTARLTFGGPIPSESVNAIAEGERLTFMRNELYRLSGNPELTR